MAMACIVSQTVGAASCDAFVKASKRKQSRVESYPSIVQCHSCTEKYLFHRHQQPQQSSGIDRSCEPCERSAARAGNVGSFKLSGVVVPLLAAALVGSMQPVVQAATEWEKLLDSVDDTTTETYTPYSGDDAYKDLVQRMKEKRSKKTFNAPTNEKSDVGASNFSSPLPTSPLPTPLPDENIVPPDSNPGSSPFSFFLPPAAKNVAPPDSNSASSPFSFFSPPPDKNVSPPDSNSGSSPFSFFSPPEAQQAPLTVEPPVAKKISEKAQEVLAAVEIENQRTHGFLPLFVTQLLLLATTLSGGYVLLTAPQSKWDELQRTVDGYVEKTTPILEDGWAKAQPVALQAQQKVQEFATKAKPYVGKAWEASKPLAAKAVEASKPILKSAQAKALELLQQRRSE